MKKIILLWSAFASFAASAVDSNSTLSFTTNNATDFFTKRNAIIKELILNTDLTNYNPQLNYAYDEDITISSNSEKCTVKYKKTNYIINKNGKTLDISYKHHAVTEDKANCDPKELEDSVNVGIYHQATKHDLKQTLISYFELEAKEIMSYNGVEKYYTDIAQFNLHDSLLEIKMNTFEWDFFINPSPLGVENLFYNNNVFNLNPSLVDVQKIKISSIQTINSPYVGHFSYSLAVLSGAEFLSPEKISLTVSELLDSL